MFAFSLQQFGGYYEYYLSVEHNLIATKPYVEHTERNHAVHSQEFSKIILLCGSELEQLLKLLCHSRGIQRAGRMSDHADALMLHPEYPPGCTAPALPVLNRVVSRDGLMYNPWDGFDPARPGLGLAWRHAYQQLRDNRVESFPLATLLNATQALAAHYLLLEELRCFVPITAGHRLPGSEYFSAYFTGPHYVGTQQMQKAANFWPR